MPFLAEPVRQLAGNSDIDGSRFRSAADASAVGAAARSHFTQRYKLYAHRFEVGYLKNEARSLIQKLTPELLDTTDLNLTLDELLTQPAVAVVAAVVDGAQPAVPVIADPMDAVAQPAAVAVVAGPVAAGAQPAVAVVAGAVVGGVADTAGGVAPAATVSTGIAFKGSSFAKPAFCLKRSRLGK
ncbi:hypothetical protein PLESTF_001641700 [Pleodorina starrii]|nr:hypothetical protein PLESTM_000627400 [Pleodorina starrii]GLC75475.1 hypothetical protein PLESTF_001641700 [Pleodorina starrii]